MAAPPTKALKSYWSSNRKDNFTTATAKGDSDAKAWKYSFTRVEGYVLTEQFAKNLDPSLVKPLKLYWSEGRKDNFTTATAKGDSDAKVHRYRFAETLGYVYTKQIPGTKPLKLYWNASRKDNFSTATKKGEFDAKASGYEFAETLGLSLIHI